MSEKSHATDGMPSSIGRYQITGTLGFGAMGAVYQAFDPIIKRSLAIKTIRLDVPRQSPQHRAFIERFYQEARISGTLSHPNIVTLFDIGEEGGVPFLAMEYVDGQTIAELLEKGVKFKPEKVIALVSQIALGLDYAHSRGVVHRDIKPSNLIVQEGDKVKVTDFGIAKLVDTEITQSGTLLGTPSYMSPEQAMGEKLDGRSDIFSLGVCAFEMLSGQQPFPGNNVTSILYKLVHVDPVEPGDLEMNGLVPHKWREVFNKVLAKKPDNRYQTASEFVRDLEFCLGSWFSGLGEETLGLEATDESTVTLPTVPRAESSPSGSEIETVVLPAPSELDETVGVPLEAQGTDDATLQINPDTLDSSETLQLPGGLATVPTPATPAPGLTAETIVLAGALLEGPATAALPAPPPAGDAETAESPLDELVVVPEPAPAPEVTQDVAAAATATKPPPGKARPLPAGRLLAGAAALFVLAAATVGWLLWQRASPAGPGPAPVPLPSPLVSDEAMPLPTLGSLQVTSAPEGARVTLNGEERGTTPLDLEELPFGVYEVGVELKGHEPQAHDVALSAGEPTAVVEVTLSRQRAKATLGRVNFTSNPPGAEVSVDGKVVGKAPVTDVRLRPGRHKVRMTLDGHAPWSGAVEVTAGRRVSLEAPLEAVPVVEIPPTPEPVDTTRIYENKAGAVDQVARKKSGDSPSYPSDRAPRLKSGQRVSVTFSFVVTETGAVEGLKVEESAGKVIDDVVVEAVKTWKFEPATIRGTPVQVRIVRKQTFLGG